MSQQNGKVAQVIGPVVDVTFPAGQKLPNILDAMVAKRPDGQELILECQRHIGEDTVRAIAMDATEGLQRGAEVVAMGQVSKDFHADKHIDASNCWVIPGLVDACARRSPQGRAGAQGHHRKQINAPGCRTF